MKVSIHQPAYLPWLGYFEKVLSSDIFVVLDTVAYSNNSFDNRNRILCNGKEVWLTIPLQKSGKFGQTYQKAFPAGSWKQSHLGKIRGAYKDAPFFNIVFPYLNQVYSKIDEKASLSDICFSMLKDFCELYECKTTLVKASDLDVSGKSTGLLIDICKKLYADTYYSGRMGKDYLDESDFEKNSIKLVYQEYVPAHCYSVVHQLMEKGAYL